MKKLMSNLYFAYSMVVVFTALGLGVGYNYGILKGQQAVDDRVLAEINKLNATVPVMLDNETQLDSVFLSSDGKSIVYRFSIVNYDREDLLESNLIPKMESLAKRTSCMNSQMSFILDYGYEYHLEYRDSAGQPVFSVKLSKGDCEAIMSQPEDKAIQDLFDSGNIEDQIRESLEPEKE